MSSNPILINLGIIQNVMNQICIWDEVFTTPTGKVNQNFIILYWYLFNKSDYQRNIAKEMKRLREMEEFKDIPATLTEANNINNKLREMEEYNLVGRVDMDKRPYYFQALSFFYIDPFCIKTPDSVAKRIEAHYEEYKSVIQDRSIIDPLRAYNEYVFNTQVNTAVMPAQKLIQQSSPSPEQFMTSYFSKKNKDFLDLYELIYSTFRRYEGGYKEDEFHNTFNNKSLSEMKRILRETGIIELENLEFDETWHYIDFGGKFKFEFSHDPPQTEKEIQEIRWLKLLLQNLQAQVWCINEGLLCYTIPVYQKLKLGQLFFDKAALQFEEY